jgi:hypothetical protein|tara:strand:- start:269 stop:433 length:165 start_codon:yes stop_codon:yes gene_type:complete
MLWDLILGLSWVGLALSMYLLAQTVTTIRKDVDDLMAMVRAIRYNSMKERDDKK